VTPYVGLSKSTRVQGGLVKHSDTTSEHGQANDGAELELGTLVIFGDEMSGEDVQEAVTQLLAVAYGRA
jgi:hypothetical protein